MSEHPFGNPDEQHHNGVDIDHGSIVDTVLKLDEFLSGEVRRAEKSAAFYTRPDLEATIEDLHAELNALLDSNGRPLRPVDQDLADGARSAAVVQQELRDVQAEYAASRRTVRMRAMDEDEWAAFQGRHRAVFSEGLLPYPPEFWEDLIVRSASAPRFTPEQLREFRAKVGHAVYDELASTAWAVNTSSGVSIPKSSLSSAALRQPTQG